MRYAPFSQVEHESHILVGGRPAFKTRIHLSNAQLNQTANHLKADLCAQIAFNWLSEDPAPMNEEAVSAEHFGGDQLVALFALVDPEQAFLLRDELVNLARAYSLEIAPDRDDAHRAFILKAWTDPELSPLNKGVFQNSEREIANILFEELLPRLPKILEKVDYLERYWKEEDERLEATEDLFIKNEIVLEEIPSLDLAVLDIAADVPLSSSFPHSIAIHNRTECSRILLSGKHGSAFYYRAESGSDFRSRSLAPRVDLTSFVGQLNEREKGNELWHLESISAPKPYLLWQGDKDPKVEKGAFKNALIEVLSTTSP